MDACRHSQNSVGEAYIESESGSSRERERSRVSLFWFDLPRGKVNPKFAQKVRCWLRDHRSGRKYQSSGEGTGWHSALSLCTSQLIDGKDNPVDSLRTGIGSRHESALIRHDGELGLPQ